MRSTLNDRTGERVGSWTVLKRAPNSTDGKVRWLCRCDCGTERILQKRELRSTKQTMCQKCWNTNHPSRKTHGMSRTPEYRRWRTMRSRCENPNVRSYKNYGGRGIDVCSQWRSFEQYMADLIAEIGPRPSPMHTLDRKDNNGNYEPGNVRWATRKEQRANQRGPAP